MAWKFAFDLESSSDYGEQENGMEMHLIQIVAIMKGDVRLINLRGAQDS